MLFSASTVLLLLGSLCLSSAAPAAITQRDLEALVKTAKYIYDELGREMCEVAMQQAKMQQIFSPDSNINFGTGTGVNGNGNFNFHGEVYCLYVNGK